MEWYVTTKGKGRKKLLICGRLWDGRFVRLPTSSDWKIAEKFRDHIASLNRSKALGELPDAPQVAWVESQPLKETERYISLGLVPQRILDKRQPIENLLEDFHVHAKAKCEDRSVAPDRKIEKIRRVFAAIGPNANFEDLEEDKVNTILKKMVTLGGKRKGQPLAQKTKREYIFALQSFCNWMIKKRGVTKNPLEDVVAPPAKGAPVLNRRPMKVDDFSKLMAYLRIAPQKYPHQIFPWTPEDRVMIYWTAVKTGLRAEELRSLTRASVDFESDPVLITVEGWVAKNRTKATVPVDDRDFIQALEEYASHRLPNAPLLRMPTESPLTTGLYRDLEAANVKRKFDNGETVDFHTLRSTSIVWWLKEGLDLLEVQHRSRLKTLSLVQDYVKHYVPDYSERVRKRRSVDAEMSSASRVS